MQYGRDHAFLHRYGQRDVNLSVVTNSFRRPTRIHSRVFGQHTRYQSD